MNKIFTDTLTTQYAVGEHRLHLLGQGAKQVFRVQRPQQDDWILRFFPTEPDGYLHRGAAELARLLIYLEEHGYMTEQVVRTKAGKATAELPEGELLVTTHIGQSLNEWVGEFGTSRSYGEPNITPDVWRKLGATMAQLHTVSLDPAFRFPKAGMLPARELTWVQQFVDEIADEVPPKWQLWYDELRNAISHSHHCEDLDRVLIHCDPNLGNAVIDEAGQVAFIDWDVVGLGPAVFDLGSMLCNCITGDLEPDAAAIHAVMDGYLSIRSLSPLEQVRLADTVSSQMLVTLGGYLPSVIRGEVSEGESIYGLTYVQWQAKYRASTEVAVIAQSYCSS